MKIVYRVAIAIVILGAFHLTGVAQQVYKNLTINEDGEIVAPANFWAVNPVPASAMTNGLSTWPGSSNITQVGTVTNGTWQGSPIATGYLPASVVEPTALWNNGIRAVHATGGSILFTGTPSFDIASNWRSQLGLGNLATQNAITLSGAVTGSGAGAITTTLAAGQARANLSGGSGTLDLSGFTLTLPSDVTRLGTAIDLGTAEATGTLADARFPATLPAISGANLTGLNASNISTGTISISRLPATVVTTDTNQTITGQKTFSVASLGTITGNYNHLTTSVTWNPPANEASFAAGAASVSGIKSGSFNANAFLPIRSLSAGAHNNGSGALSGAVSYYARMTQTGSGTVASMYGFYMDIPFLSGGASTPITNMYGIYISPLAQTGVTNAYGIWQEGTADTNRFRGAVNLFDGSVTLGDAPADELVVNDDDPQLPNVTAATVEAGGAKTALNREAGDGRFDQVRGALFRPNNSANFRHNLAGMSSVTANGGTVSSDPSRQITATSTANSSAFFWDYTPFNNGSNAFVFPSDRSSGARFLLARSTADATGLNGIKFGMGGQNRTGTPIVWGSMEARGACVEWRRNGSNDEMRLIVENDAGTENVGSWIPFPNPSGTMEVFVWVRNGTAFLRARNWWGGVPVTSWNITTSLSGAPSSTNIFSTNSIWVGAVNHNGAAGSIVVGTFEIATFSTPDDLSGL